MNPRRNTIELNPGDAVDQVFLVADKQVRINRQGAPYLQLSLRDKTGAIEARLWNAGEEMARRFDAGDYLQARGKVQTFQGANQLILTGFELIGPDQVDPAEYRPVGVSDIDKLVKRLKDLLLSVKNPHLRALVECFLIDDEFLRKFCAAPAGVRNHHAYHGGLLEHVVTLLTLVDRTIDLYPEVDRDLLLAGAFLHDVGKIDELTYEHTFGYSDAGQLVGHLVIGVGILREKIARSVELLGEPFPEELRLRLEHMIVSHHGSHEFGSPKVPMTLEAVALHYLDNLDAKLHAVAREMRDETALSAGWTPFNPALNRRLFKGSGETNGG